MSWRTSHHERDQEMLRTDRALADTLPEIIWTCDAQGRLEWCNNRWYEITGLSELETLYDKGALVAVHPDDRDDVVRQWTQALATSSGTELEYRIRDRAGEYRWYLARVAPVKNDRNEVTRWVSAVIDIHDRRLADEARRASQRQFDSFFHINPIPLAITRTSDGAYLLVNDAFVAMSGFPREEAVGRSSVELGMWSEQVRADAVAHFRVANGRSFETEVRRKDGRVMMLMLSSSQLEIDGVLCFLTSAVDMTERREMEDALREREAQARAAGEALRLANRQKDEFLALLSHELRNPLTPILTSARLLEMRADAESRRDIDVIVRQVKHMSRLVEDLLDVARVARGAVTLEKAWLEPATAIARAVEATAPLFRDRGHRLEIDVPEHGLAVDADAVRLTQIVDNLLSNAALYSPPGGTVRVSARRDGDNVSIRVRDSGHGIEPSLLPHVFDLFVQGLRGPDRAEGGLGVGLSLVRTLTELHGGTVAAHSGGPGLGSEFTVCLPATARVPESVSSPEAPSMLRTLRGHGARVLIVDDRRDVVDGLARFLRLVGFEPRVALNPLDALTIAETFRPHVALLDIGLPVMDGYMLADELRARLGDRMPALIALTGYDQARDRLRSHASGFARHLAKPVDVDELVDAINELAPDEASCEDAS